MESFHFTSRLHLAACPHVELTNNSLVLLQRAYLTAIVFLSVNYRLIVAPQKFDVLKTNLAREAKLRGQIR